MAKQDGVNNANAFSIGHGFVAVVDNAIVPEGVVVGVIGVHGPVGGVAWLSHLFVAERYRRQGIGSLLVENAVRYAVEYGATAMKLAVVRNNEAAIGFWKAHGFRIKPLVVVEMLGVHGPVGGVAMVREVGHMTTAGQSR